MQGISRLAAVTLISAAVAFALSWLPRIDSAGYSVRSEMALGQSGTAGLTDQNLVDRISRLPLQLDIRRVGWSQGVLSIDFAVQGRPQDYAVFHDLLELSEFLGRTSNISQAAVRVLETGPGGAAQLLVAMDARQEDLKGRYADKPPEGSENIKRYLQTRHRLSFTQRWREPMS